MAWVDEQLRRGVRQRTAPQAPPTALGMLPIEQRDLLALWVRKDNASRGRDALLKESGRNRIEVAEGLCDWLLREGWITRKEKLVGGHWQWDSLMWRDLAALKQLLGVGSRDQRGEERALVLDGLQQWLAECSPQELGPDHAGLLKDIHVAVDSLQQEPPLRVEVLEARSCWLKALHMWCLDERQGTRRDFALYAGEHTKAIGQGDWKWLEDHFDLERLGVSHFTPLIWLAGQAVLRWTKRTLDLGAVHFAALPLDDVRRITGLADAPAHWWLIENRTSFERQAQKLAADTVLVWMPGRTSMAWLAALEHLVRCAPAPLWVSADADPSGVDMACSVGRVWERLGLAWEPFRMGRSELSAVKQSWILNAHDRALLSRLLETPDLPPQLRELCDVMQREGRKAEQEGWL